MVLHERLRIDILDLSWKHLYNGLRIGWVESSDYASILSTAISAEPSGHAKDRFAGHSRKLRGMDSVTSQSRVLPNTTRRERLIEGSRGVNGKRRTL